LKKNFPAFSDSPARTTAFAKTIIKAVISAHVKMAIRERIVK
jgi:hypothetical protein